MKSLLAREGIIIIVPNSKLVSDNVINWTHNRKPTRFNVSVGVAYGSNIELAEKIILEVAQQSEKVVNDPKPFTRFVDFCNSSLDLEVHFWSLGMWEIENIKSEIRLGIYKAFQKNNIEIPFPQRDVHIKTKAG
ncbi:mechanosensitive ion channel family protein [Reichenbachiella versicolor]|uniref:mechanosensitive ion channel family protein n=1 Tax=Reichenbachiella versicolor TaxID=1821036 RepID=UPI0013A5B63B|nr:mechanosensitive ion channel domain-containing protein [Reichenbachiella versicolor]